MVEGWRSRYMAPVYALIFSFLLVFGLGAVLNRSAELVQLVADTGDPAGLASVTAEVRVHDGATSAGQTFPFEVPDGTFDVCLTLPSGWTAGTGQAVARSGTLTCWANLRPGAGDVVLHLRVTTTQNKTKNKPAGHRPVG